MTTALTLGLLSNFLIMVLTIVKDRTILDGIIPYMTLAGLPEIKPNFLDKCTTATQVLLLVSVLLSLCFTGTLSELFFNVFFWIVATMTWFDGVSYHLLWTLQLVDDPRWKEST